MMRLIKDSSNELGIIISSKKNTGNGMSGYSIAHIEPRGLIDRYLARNNGCQCEISVGARLLVD